MIRFPIYQAGRRYLVGGRAALEDLSYSFRPIAASSADRPRGITVVVEAAESPSFWVVAPDGSELVRTPSDLLLCPRGPARLDLGLAARDAAEAAIEERGGLTAEFEPATAGGVGH